MRDTRIDILRFIGLAMIIFAHVDPPALLFQLRNFDVPLMVLVSGMSFFLSYTPHVSYSDYVWQRVRRLVFPVWVFLTLYFLAQYVLMPDAPDLNFGTVFGSYALMNGIGYVWVIRVFLLIALLSPFLYRVNKSVKEDKKYFLMLGCLYLLYETLRYVVLSSGKGGVVSLILFEALAYSFVFSMGVRLQGMARRSILILIFVNVSVFLFSAIVLCLANGGVVPTQVYKYPPSIYYLSYALSVSLMIWLGVGLVDKLLTIFGVRDVVLFLANNTIWIYLWHIPLVKVVHMSFVLKYLVVFASAAFATRLQLALLNGVVLPKIKSDTVRRSLKTVFSG